MKADLRARARGTMVEIEIHYEGGDSTPLGFVDPDEARKLAHYLNVMADLADSNKRDGAGRQE